MKQIEWKITPSPFIYTRLSEKNRILVLLVSLIPMFIMLYFDRDYKAFINIGCATLGVFGAQFLFNFLNKKVTLYNSSLLSGVLTAFLLPTTLHPITVVFVSFLGSFFSSSVFGGKGSYWFNPIIASVVISYIAFPSEFPSFLIHKESLLATGNPLDVLRFDNFSFWTNDNSLVNFLNTTYFSHINIKIPEGYITLLWSFPSTIPAIRYNVLILFSSIIILTFKTIDWIVPTISLFVYSLLVYFMPLVFSNIFQGKGDILFGLCTSSILFLSFYILPDCSTNPRTTTGRIITGLVSGIIFYFFCGPGGSYNGAIFSIVLINVFTTIIEKIEKKY